MNMLSKQEKSFDVNKTKEKEQSQLTVGRDATPPRIKIRAKKWNSKSVPPLYFDVTAAFELE